MATILRDPPLSPLNFMGSAMTGESSLGEFAEVGEVGQ
jgi:hypothetical protein